MLVRQLCAGTSYGRRLARRSVLRLKPRLFIALSLNDALGSSLGFAMSPELRQFRLLSLSSCRSAGLRGGGLPTSPARFAGTRADIDTVLRPLLIIRDLIAPG